MASFGVMRSPPCRIFWEGFEGYTDGMQRRGWEFAVDNDLDYSRRRSMRLVFRHRHFGWTGIAECNDPYRLMEALDWPSSRHSDDRERWPTFDACVMRESQDRTYIDRPKIALLKGGYSFTRVDMEPVYEVVERVSLRALDIFREWKDPEEIIVDPDTVSTLLEKIKKMQAPELTAIRERNRLREARERAPEVRHATILSIAA